MRVVLYLFIVLLFCACQAPEKHRRTTTLVLKDNRGIIKMDLPPSWDTAFQWTHYSDCGLPCARVKYRFQHKAFPIALEDGWLYLKFPLDSVEQLTIIQEAGKQVMKDTLAAVRQFRENRRKAFLMDNHHAHFVIDTIMQVERHLIPVVGVFNEINHMQICNINALAILKGEGVIFEFKLLAKEQNKGEEHFLAEVMNVIRSVELEE